MRDPHVADFALGFVVGVTVGIALAAVAWAAFGV